MTVLFAGVGLFIAAIVIHVVLWRIRVPQQQARCLIFIILIVAGLGTSVFLYLGLESVGLPVFRLLLALGVFGSLAAIYLILFSAIEADSPTLTILNLIDASGAQGIREEDLRLAMTQHSYVRTRINQLFQDGMVVETSRGLELKSTGQLLCTLVLFYRRLLRRDVSGG